MNTPAPLSPEVWERTPAEAQAYIRALEARVAALEATVQRLLERLRMDSQNSSQPPSSDPPAMRRPRQRHRSSRRKPGGQPGHHGQTRALVPLEEVAAVLPVKPTHCTRCQHPLHGAGWPATAASGDRPAARTACRDRVSGACPGVPRVWDNDPRRPPQLGCRPGALVPMCRPSSRCVRAPITCRSAPPRRSWPTCLGYR